MNRFKWNCQKMLTREQGRDDYVVLFNLYLPVTSNEIHYHTRNYHKCTIKRFALIWVIFAAMEYDLHYLQKEYSALICKHSYTTQTLLLRKIWEKLMEKYPKHSAWTMNDNFHTISYLWQPVKLCLCCIFLWSANFPDGKIDLDWWGLMLEQKTQN